MAKSKITLKFQQFDEQTVEAITRIVGFVKASSFVEIIDATEDLSSNPRSSKVGRVTADIQESIQNTPETLPFKTKGVLLATSDYERLERKRFLLNFDHGEVNGVLDGGHNTLAIGMRARCTRAACWCVWCTKHHARSPPPLRNSPALTFANGVGQFKGADGAYASMTWAVSGLGIGES